MPSGVSGVTTMSDPLLTGGYQTLLTGALVLVSVLTLICGYRVVVGPTVPDRVVALETIGINVVAIAILFALSTDRGFFVLIALVLAIVGFVSTVAVAEFITEGDIIR